MRILIVASSENHAIGKDNKLLWHLPKDFKRFKALTTGYPIIMGRKTFESLPGILPNRTHIIISRNPNFKIEHPDVKVVSSLGKAYEITQKYEKCFIIGGGEIYRQAIQDCDVIELTLVHTEIPDADTFFKVEPIEQWKIDKEERILSDEKHKFDFSFITYTKK